LEKDLETSNLKDQDDDVISPAVNHYSQDCNIQFYPLHAQGRLFLDCLTLRAKALSPYNTSVTPITTTKRQIPDDPNLYHFYFRPR